MADDHTGEREALFAEMWALEDGYGASADTEDALVGALVGSVANRIATIENRLDVIGRG